MFAVLCWFAAPIVAQKFVTSEPDVTVSVLLFAAFHVWWKGMAAGRVSMRRWIAVGAILAAAAMTKGPQPVGYFTLGVGAVLLVRRRWRDLPGFLLANAMAAAVVGAWYVAVAQQNDIDGWLAHSRLARIPPGVWIKDMRTSRSAWSQNGFRARCSSSSPAGRCAARGK